MRSQDNILYLQNITAISHISYISDLKENCIKKNLENSIKDDRNMRKAAFK